MSARVPRWVQRVTITAVAAVAAVAAVVSYVHMHELATRAGEEWRAVLVPVSVDGMLVAASMVMFVRRREGLRAGWLPWIGLILGLLASLGANLAVARPDIVSIVVSGWPPLALAISFELLILVNRADPPAPPPPPPTAGDERVTSLVAAGLGRRKLARELEIPEYEARKLIDATKNGDGG